MVQSESNLLFNSNIIKQLSQRCLKFALDLFNTILILLLITYFGYRD